MQLHRLSLCKLFGRSANEGPNLLPGSRELDEAIALAVGWTPLNGKYCGEWWVDPRDGALKLLPPFTTSIDAAVTLVPEGFRWSVVKCRRDATASVGPEGSVPARGSARTAPLAICIAALRARATT